MTGIVLDASVAVKLVSDETGSDAAMRQVTEADEIVAPDWIVIEVAHALWKKVKANELDRSAAEAGVAGLSKFIDRMVASQTLLSDALRLSYGLPHPIYDCLYLALADREGIPLVTVDEKFIAQLEQSEFRSMVRAL